MHSFTAHMLFATAALSSVASGHLILTKPTPFKFQNPDYKRSPLLPDGSDYPCKKVNGQPLQSQGTNPISVGQTYNLEWDNYVTHGGGTCQLSVTRDLDPTKSSVFKVIKSWEGGCPMASEGNNWAAPLPWEMPAEVQNGDAVLAWTWIPRLSLNEEIYMNCAPVEITGGADDDSAFNALPNLFLPNLQSDCHSGTTGKNLMIPNAGKYTVKLGAQYGFTDATGGACGSDSGPAPAPPHDPPTYTSSAAATTTSAPPAKTDSAIDVGPNRGFNGQSSDQTAAAPEPVAPVPQQPAAQQAAPENTGSSSGSSTSNVTPVQAPAAVGDANQTCPEDGRIVCRSEKEFALCNFGKVDQWLQTADGTVCRDGEIKVSEEYAGKARKAARSDRLKRHLAMHHKHHARSMAA
ncbi:hypothetical protein BDZ85DRAFT_262609 [Elsinoe ampelina]|uniref:Carbohydrate-binding module family 19 domain-containing protein n=1 Tax=Elsinoe ampelina TaxID=302913 RepID=A0A6A6GAY4_9PEZI|nr:hypothetical protein BDZ85DRAFT_262609 [Elsinoe ampelina]